MPAPDFYAALVALSFVPTLAFAANTEWRPYVIASTGTSVDMPVPGSLPRCIRLLVHAYTRRTRGEIKHCYLRGATVLRPDRA